MAAMAAMAVMAAVASSDITLMGMGQERVWDGASSPF
jgi:hypothetical protein